jgi:hypothetical protein
MKLKIKITQEVLEATKMCGLDGFKLKGSEYEGSAHNCAITYACRKLFPNCHTISCGIYMIYGDEITTIAYLPRNAINFIERFDRATPTQRVKMKPFEFEVELIKEVLDLITIDEITKILETSTTLEMV